MARDFNGSNQYGQVSLDLTAYSTLSVALWLYPDTIPPALDYDIYLEFTADGAATAGGFTMYSGGSEGFVVAHCGNVGTNNAIYTALTADVMIHVVGVFDFTQGTNEVNFYKDGTLQTATLRPSTSNNTGAFANSTLNIAARNAASLHADCRIAELAIYSGDIGATGAGQLAKGFAPSLVLPASLIRYWPMVGRYSPEIELKRAEGITLTNSPAAIEHPRIIQPSRRNRGRQWETAAAATGLPGLVGRGFGLASHRGLVA